MSTIRPTGVWAPSEHGLRYKDKGATYGVLHVAYTNDTNLYLGGIVTGPATPSRSGASPATWNVVTLVCAAPPFIRLDTELIAISPETYLDLVHTERDLFWPTLNEHTFILTSQFKNKARRAGLHIEVPDWLKADIHAASVTKAYNTILVDESGARGVAAALRGCPGEIFNDHPELEIAMDQYLQTYAANK